MKIQILGSGCPRCKTLEKHAQQAIQRKNLDASIEKVQDMDKIMEMGVMMTPALAIDGEVKQSGKVLSVEEIEKILAG